MSLKSRIRRLEHMRPARGKVWVLGLPGTTLAELRRTEREIGPWDHIFFFDLRACDERQEADENLDELVEAIFRKQQEQN